ncbi:hypothetical protein DH2020_003271 [Rehmannia glutinosa]|uniref:CBS domain-containing protein n=1 Tax=Rehmannia glutinosa TaxID=99300 RepID=A0ABR0XLA8_REHGL
MMDHDREIILQGFWARQLDIMEWMPGVVHEEELPTDEENLEDETTIARGAWQSSSIIHEKRVFSLEFREPDTIPAVFSSEIAGRSHMEVDSGPFLPGKTGIQPKDDFLDKSIMFAFAEMTCLYDTLQEALSSISQAEMELSRNRVSVFLSSHTAYELLPESGKVIALDVNLPVKQAFHLLYEQGVSVAPLWDLCKGKFVGVLSASDFILILREVKCLIPKELKEFYPIVQHQLGNHGSNLTEEELETHTISAWKEGKAHLNGQIAGNIRSYSRHLIHAGPYDSLKDVAFKLLQYKVSTVPVIHSSSQDGSYPQLLHLASLSGILKCICRHFKHSSSSLPILQQPICSFPLGTWVPKIGESNGKSIAMLRPNASLSAALSLLVQADVSSLPIVDENDSLVDIYCRSDITALAKDALYAQVRLDDLSIHQAIHLGQDAISPNDFFNGQRCQMCLRSDPLHKVMERLSIPGVRRVVIVEAGSKRVEGIISLSDVFSFLLG